MKQGRKGKVRRKKKGRKTLKRYSGVSSVG